MKETKGKTFTEIFSSVCDETTTKMVICVRSYIKNSQIDMLNMMRFNFYIVTVLFLKMQMLERKRYLCKSIELVFQLEQVKQSRRINHFVAYQSEEKEYELICKTKISFQNEGRVNSKAFIEYTHIEDRMQNILHIISITVYSFSKVLIQMLINRKRHQI